MLKKKYYDGTQIHRIISEEVKDYETIMKILKRFADEPSAQPGYIEQIKWERDVAIQQLSELGYGLGEKPRTDGDTISRKTAIDAIGEVHPLDYNAQAIKTRIESLPSAQTMRPKGHWTSTGDIPDYCSECGNSWIDDYVDGWEGIWLSGITPNFCPNCGADMREEHDDSSQE